MMFGYGTGVGFGLDGWLGMIGMVILVVGVILLIAWLVGRFASATQAQPPATQSQPPAAATLPAATTQSTGHDAVELLRMRFARGEITEDEFRSAKQVLEEGR